MSDELREGDAGRIMDKAETADRRALFAALQAALGPIIDAEFGRYRGGGLRLVEEALDRGAEYGSPEHLAEVRENLRARGLTADE